MDHTKAMQLEVLLIFNDLEGLTGSDLGKLLQGFDSYKRAAYNYLNKNQLLTYGFKIMEDGQSVTWHTITDEGKSMIKQLEKQKVDEVTKQEEGKEARKWGKSGAYGAWVASLLTLVSIIITLYFGCNNSPKEIFDEKGYQRIQMEMDSIKNIMNDSTRKADSGIRHFIAPAEFDSVVKSSSKKLEKPKIVYDCCDSTDSLEPKPPKVK